jgi:hypothetical protein
LFVGSGDFAEESIPPAWQVRQSLLNSSLNTGTFSNNCTCSNNRCRYALRDVVTRGTQLGELELVQTFLRVIAPAITDQEDQPKDEEVDELDFMEEQSLVGRFISLLYVRHTSLCWACC